MNGWMMNFKKVFGARESGAHDETNRFCARPVRQACVFLCRQLACGLSAGRIQLRRGKKSDVGLVGIGGVKNWCGLKLLVYDV